MIEDIKLNERPQFFSKSLPALITAPWLLWGDSFPFNEDITPGAVAFDTTTALVKPTLNIGNPQGGQGVALGDTLVYTSSFTGDDARVDLVFRIWPGPGNYAGRSTGGGSQDPWALRHNRILKVPAAGDVPANYATPGDGSFWGQYMADNGLVGSKPSGHMAYYWDPQTWNSARMDSAQCNFYPLIGRGLGVPVPGTWMGTYHEYDPKYATLGILRALCFLVDPDGPNDNSNTCCSPAQCAAPPFNTTWPPAVYDPGEQTSTVEGTKILPDGIFTPGTLIQYFVRRSRVSDPMLVDAMSPDTTTVSLQEGMGQSKDLLRYDHMAVLPDLWKDMRFSGPGLACILFVDAADDRGFEPAAIGALDSLGYGTDAGAERGWRQGISNWGNVDDPSGFVSENRGQMGLAYDKFDIRAAGFGEGGRLGCRIVGSGVEPELMGVQCKQGPTPAMLDRYYRTILWESGDLDHSSGALHDGSGLAGEQSDDAALLSMWLAAAAFGNEKALFLSGDGVAEDLHLSGAPSMNTLASTLGMVFVYGSYFEVSGNLLAGAVFQPLATTSDYFHSSRRYGFLNSSLNRLDVIDADGGVVGAEMAARYEQYSDRNTPGAGPGPYGAAVYRGMDWGAGRYFATLLTGFSLSRLRAWNGFDDPATQGIPLTYNNFAQHAWMDDALSAFNLCARVAPVIAVGEQPGVSAVNFVRGAVPNPSVAGAVTVQFSLTQPAKVTLRFYNVAGRLVHETTVNGVPGLNNYRWEGKTSSGMRAASGVYFYRLSAPGIEFQNNGQRMVLLGGAGR